MHHDEWHEPLRAEARIHLSHHVLEQGILDRGRLLAGPQTRGSFSSRPSPFSLLRQSVVVDHGRGNTRGILLQVIDDVLPDGRPMPDTAAPPAQTSVANDSGTDRIVAPRQQVLAENLVDEGFFGLTFQVNQ